MPHQYPLPATSMLLINDNGQLINKTQEFALELEDVGMITDAIWSDYDNDGQIDLALVGEWMPITFLKNEKGSLQKKNLVGLEDSSGWWYSLEEGDFDNDGIWTLSQETLDLTINIKHQKRTLLIYTITILMEMEKMI